MDGRRGLWGRAAITGLAWGGIGIFLSLVGMVEAFAQREIVAGVISLGHALLLLTGLVAGYQASRRAGAGTVPALLHGILAGSGFGAALAGLVVAGSFLDLRAVFVNASPGLFALLAFGRGGAGAGLLVPAGAAIGAAGAALVLVSAQIRLPFITGLGCVFFFGLFQELLQLLLPGGQIGAAMRAFLFSASGLSLNGGLSVFLVAWGLSAVWRRRRAAIRRRFSQLPAPHQRKLRWLAMGLGVAVLLFVPLAAGPFLSQVLVLVGLFALLGLGLNVVVGFAGMLDLGYVAFFAIGAYTVGLLTSSGEHGIAGISFWAAVPFVMIASLVAGVLLGIPVLKTRGDYLAIVTMGFGEIIRLLVLSDFLRPWLGGSQGVLAIPKPMIGGFEFRGPEQLFYVTLGGVALVIFVAIRLRDSRLGRAWIAVREDEDVAEAMGINLVNVKLLAFGVGATFAGVGGAIFAVMLGSVFPHSFQLLISFNVLALIIVGGMGSIPGVVVGSLTLIGLPELLREFSEFRFLVYGAALVLMMQLRPEGLWPEAGRKRELREGEAAAAPPGGSGARAQGGLGG
jgi:branched-chain amino acid transport system permease protein